MSAKTPQRYRGPNGLANFEADLFTAGCQPNPGSHRAQCPGHGGRNRSLSYKLGNRGRLLVKCHSADCSREEIFAGLERSLKGMCSSTPPSNRATVQPSPPAGITLTAYAEAKRVPGAFLGKMFGLDDYTYRGVSKVRMPYYLRDGSTGPMRYRLCLEKGDHDERFRWEKGSHPRLYGLWLVDPWQKAGVRSVVLVEGESDVHTLVHAGIPALGIPGANNWRDVWAPEFDGFEHIYIVEEPDTAGQKLAQTLAASPLADRLSIMSLDKHKDVSELWLSDPNRRRFKQRIEKARKAAVPAARIQQRERERRNKAAWKKCCRLARHQNILRAFLRDLKALSVVGEDRAASLVFLQLVSRLLPRPVSAVLKGPSAAGKSWIAENVLRFFPDSAFYRLSGMSERFLVYDPEPFAHRIIYIAEAAGMEGDIASYLVRTLLSEGRLIWGTVDKVGDGELAGRRIEKEGPTGALITTTRVKVHPENETRLLSIPVNDTPEQTRNVFRARANGHAPEPNFSLWHALSDWLEDGERRVEIPFAQALAEMIPPVAVRLRRDFGMLLVLIQAHALLHRATRKLDGEGRIIAELADYAAIWDLVGDLMSEGVGSTVSPTVKETVAAVQELERVAGLPGRFIMVTEVAKQLQIDKGSASRRVRAAISAGYLRNAEIHRGRPKQLSLGEPLPVEVEILPAPERLHGCTVDWEGRETNSPSKPRKRKKKGATTPKPRPRRGDSRQSLGGSQ